MPAILTHDFFGRDALEDAQAALGALSPDERDAFLLGNQGPDPLFYLVADPRVDASMRIGSLMHHERPSRLLAALHDALQLVPVRSRRIGEAYAAGFLCHYLLDSSVHPLVYATQYALCDAGVEGLDRTDGPMVHAEIERDLDEAVLFAKTGLTVRAWRPYAKVLAGSREVLATVDLLYFYLGLWVYGAVLDTDLYTHAVRAFRLVQRLFYSPGGLGRRLVGPLERAVTRQRHSLYCAMAHRARPDASSAFDNADRKPWEHPFTGDVGTEGFWDLYRLTLARVPVALTSFRGEGFDRALAEALTHGKNFCGAPVDEDAPVGSLHFD